MAESWHQHWESTESSRWCSSLVWVTVLSFITLINWHRTPSLPHTIRLLVFPGCSVMTKKGEGPRTNMWRAERPLLIKATNALGKTCKQKRKWSETTQHAGSKHLMECPAWWANRLLQIERNSRRLNRATWNISSCSFSQFPIGKVREGGKKLPWLLLFGAARVAFIHLQSILEDWITAECQSE